MDINSTRLGRGASQGGLGLTAVPCSSVSAQRSLQCQGLWTGRLDSWLPQHLPQKQEVILFGETGPLPPQDLRVFTLEN